jgi:hypothetical protein
MSGASGRRSGAVGQPVREDIQRARESTAMAFPGCTARGSRACLCRLRLWCRWLRCYGSNRLTRASEGDRPIADDPPPLKWSDLRYVFDIKEDCNGKEAIQA